MSVKEDRTTKTQNKTLTMGVYGRNCIDIVPEVV